MQLYSKTDVETTPFMLIMLCKRDCIYIASGITKSAIWFVNCHESLLKPFENLFLHINSGTKEGNTTKM